MDVLQFKIPYKRFALLERGMRPLSYKSIWASVQMLCAWGKTSNLKQYDEAAIRAFLYWGRSERLWSARTFRNHRQYLKTFFDWLLKQQLIKSNPVLNIEKPKLPRRIPRCLTKEQALQVIQSIRWYPWRYSFEAIRNEAILTTFILTGIRCQELLNLKLEDINLASTELIVRQGKGMKDRIVPLHPRLVPLLREYMCQRKKQVASPHFFTGIASCKPLTGKDIRRICKKLSQSTSIHFTPHMLRHTFGRLAVEADLELFKIKEIMGHSVISTTQNYLSVSTRSIKRSFSEAKLI